MTTELKASAGIQICPHFGTCGGCASLDQAYEAQLNVKRAALTSRFGKDLQITAVLGESDHFAYQLKARFVTGNQSCSSD